MKITIVGIGYVGLANAVLLAQHHEVILIDIIKEKVAQVNRKESPIKDPYISAYLKSVKLKIRATTNYIQAYKNSDLVIIATPTDYDPSSNFFNTLSIEWTIKKILSANHKIPILIKSTIPVGYTKKIRKEFNYQKIIFSPEFLREGRALHDSLYPSRIVIGSKKIIGKKIAQVFSQCCLKDNVDTIYTSSNEAEAIKLFSNTFLAMRVTFFNELDSFAAKNKLNSQDIINGVCLDNRIGNYYNNPSFGYGGYCLPKDTKQLLANYQNVPNNIIKAIVDGNETRKAFIASEILKKKPKLMGVYRLIMKSNSDNYRESAIFGVIKKIQNENIEILIYEPGLKKKRINGFKVTDNLKLFKKNTDIIIANRIDSELLDVQHKIYSRDITNEN